MKQTALVTGASSGIGFELAKIFARDNIDVVLVARSKSKLQQLKEEIEQTTSASAYVMPFDLSQPDAPNRLYQQI